ncbi:hypothetical protein KSP40_PGU008599 [Platanthera guangdongensis]|uniref:Uncharacterized protein n=1 Tax=Platanthera guangdongensis TaxID=2320717 RepID=A0ABR2M9F3_9ASPA
MASLTFNRKLQAETNALQAAEAELANLKEELTSRGVAPPRRNEVWRSSLELKDIAGETSGRGVLAGSGDSWNESSPKWREEEDSPRRSLRKNKEEGAKRGKREAEPVVIR